MSERDNSKDAAEDLNVANLMETKFKRSAGADDVNTSRDAAFAIDPARFIQSRYPCVEPDARNSTRSLIRAENCLFAAFGDQLPPAGVPLTKILAEMEAALLIACTELKLGYPDQETLKRAADRWYELMVTVTLWNANVSQLGLNNRAPIWVWLPGTNELTLSELFDSTSMNAIRDLAATLANGGAILALSNPNFVWVEPGRIELPSTVYQAIESYSPKAHQTVTRCYRQFLGKFRYTDLHLYLGLKTLYRPDRHLWIPYEAGMLKTLYARLARDLDGRLEASVRYYAISSFEPSKADEELFCAASPLAILDNRTPVERAVDGLLFVETLSELSDLHRLFTVRPPTTDR